MSPPHHGSHFNAERLQEIKALGDLPSPKGAALAVMRLTQKADVSVAELAHAVQTDPALVGRLIKAANALHNKTRPVAAVQDALILLGISTVRYLALSFSLVSGYRSGQCTNFNYPRFWSHSLACAVAMQALASRTRIASPEEAFSIGLLSRIGELSLASVFPQEYAQVLERRDHGEEVPLVIEEQDSFAVTHSELSAAMLQDWGLPGMFVEAVFKHEEPERLNAPPDSRLHQIVWMLALARLIADLCLADEANRRILMPKLFLYGGKLAIESEALVSLGDQVAREWREWATLLNVDAHEVPPFEEFSQLPAAPVLSADGMPSSDGEVALRVLIVDDDRVVRTILKTILNDSGYQVFEAVDGQQGFMMALEIHPHIIITDWVMPNMDGLGMAKALRQTKFGRGIFILILTALETEEKLVEAFDAGVDDFLIKPLKPRVLGARLRAGQRVVMLQQEIERDRDEIRRFAAELAVTNRRLQEVALTDVLTGLPNRRYAIEFFRREWLAANRSKRPLGCMLVDVDNFKAINDSYGHDVGDIVLKQVAQAIKSGLRAQDVVCRTGGDEFTVICPDTDLRAALVCAERVRREVVDLKFANGIAHLTCSLSIGVAVRDVGTGDIDALLKRADEGVYLAKQRGRNRVATVQALA
ncbi:MAG: diguanylate cyclase [Pseudomonadota bacterium]